MAGRKHHLGLTNYILNEYSMCKRMWGMTVSLGVNAPLLTIGPG